MDSLGTFVCFYGIHVTRGRQESIDPAPLNEAAHVFGLADGDGPVSLAATPQRYGESV